VSTPTPDHDPVEPRPRPVSFVAQVAFGIAGIVATALSMSAWVMGALSITDPIHGEDKPFGGLMAIHVLLAGVLGWWLAGRRSLAARAFGIGLLIGAGLESLLVGGCLLS
jgi:hypothetical protein